MGSFYDYPIETGPSSRKRPYPFDNQNTNDIWDTTPLAQFDISDQGEIVRPHEDQRYCFGSLIDVNAELSRSEQLTWINSGSHDAEGNFFFLEYDGIVFATLNKGICKALDDLTQAGFSDFCGFATHSDWSKVRGGPYSSYSTMRLEINVYGARKDAAAVGAILSKWSKFLQPPRYGLEDAKYHNPHVLQIDNYDEEDSTQVSSSTPSDNSVQQKPRRGAEVVPSSDGEAVDSILDSLSHHTIQREISSIQGINSRLLDHQTQAIDFVLQRESGQGDSKLSLWQHRNEGSDKSFYRHVFTGAKRPEPTEAKGGIIADEMGLGKSLVILSVISSSLGNAEEFGKTFDNQHESHPSRKVPSKATLIIVPSPLLVDNWVDEIAKRHISPKRLEFHRHLGQGRKKEKELLRKCAVVFTTYSTVATEFSHGDTTLMDIKWFRIVLDEGDKLTRDPAHDIRNPKTNQFRAVASLNAEHRWCLTGTPIQNSLEDLGALVMFLQVPIMSHAPTFRKFIINPIALRPTDPGRFRNLQTLLQTICIRRTRQLIDLPEPIRQDIRVSFTDQEQVAYRRLLDQCKDEIDRAVGGHRKKLKSAVLESLLKLRLFCNNGSANFILQTGPKGLPLDSELALEALRQHELDNCGYCGRQIHLVSDIGGPDDGMFLPYCCHLVHLDCTTHNRKENSKCPSCMAGVEPLSMTLSPPISGPEYDVNANMPQSGQYPSKLVRLANDIRLHPNEKRLTQAFVCSIVFSCWKKTLVLVKRLLQERGINHDMIDGSKPLSARLKILSSFRSRIGFNILLMTLGTGAVGLNLAVASRVYLLEPQWNPSIESQAIGRALRLGQVAQVSIVRYLMVDSIEEVCPTTTRSKTFGLAKEESSPWQAVDSVVEDTASLRDSQHYW
ncbi:unnamed protein product [Clonostachys rosea]|uniref:RING-type domain-containing protein n=1 Tax=Bionectria ochroleuca TaxID=29856 RepID=A0ABY6TYK9_BIOOC|nr:unnamed protein product [Clonostachys rosea]